MYLTENLESSTRYCKDSTVNEEIVVNKWDTSFYSKLNNLYIYNFGFNKIFPGNHGVHDSFQQQSSWMQHACNGLQKLEIGHFDSTRKQYYSLFPCRNPEHVITQF